MKIKNVLFLFLILGSNLFSHDKDKITLQLDWLNQFQFAGYYVAKEKGFYSQHNLDVTIKEFNNNINLVDNVLENENTYSIGKSSLIIDKLNNKDIILLSAIYQSSPIALISLKKSNITTIHDLENKKVMITPTAKDAANIKSMIKSQNLNLEDINFVPHSFNLDDLINGEVDAMGSYIANEPYILKNQNIEFNIFKPSDFGFDFYGGLLFTSNKELDNNPLRVKKFHEASIKGWNYAFANIEETSKLIYEGKVLSKLALTENVKELGDINSNKIAELKRLYLVLGLTNNSKIKLDNFIYDNKKVILNKFENKFINNNSFALLTNVNNTPFSFMDDEQIKGIEIDLLNLLKKKTGINFNIIEKTKNSFIFKNIETNTLNFEFNYSKEYINHKKKILSKPLLTIPMALATTNNKNLIQDLSSLDGQKLAILRDSSIYQKIKSDYTNIDFILVKTKEEAFSLLKNKKVFGFIDNILSLSHEIIKEKLPNIKISGALPYNLELRLLTNKENFLLIDIINKIIPLLSNEEKDQIRKKYQLIFIKQVNDYSWIYKFILPLLFAIIIILLINNKMRKEISKRKEAEESLQDLANKDSLTGIYNRGKIDSLLRKAIRDSQNSEEALSIIFFDIDDFKQINDDFGHIKGDSVLIEIANLVSNNIRETDIIGRWGGEEFIILLPKITSQKAFVLASNLKDLIANYDFNINRSLTISLGITQYKKNDTKENLMKRADEAMYYVKSKGKNAVKIL